MPYEKWHQWENSNLQLLSPRINSPLPYLFGSHWYMKMADEVGFEPTEAVNLNTFQEYLLKPDSDTHPKISELVVPEGLEPSLLSKADFLTNYSFHCLVVGLVCGLDFTFSILSMIT